MNERSHSRSSAKSPKTHSLTNSFQQASIVQTDTLFQGSVLLNQREWNGMNCFSQTRVFSIYIYFIHEQHHIISAIKYQLNFSNRCHMSLLMSLLSGLQRSHPCSILAHHWFCSQNCPPSGKLYFIFNGWEGRDSKGEQVGKSAKHIGFSLCVHTERWTVLDTQGYHCFYL